MGSATVDGRGCAALRDRPSGPQPCVGSHCEPRRRSAATIPAPHDTAVRFRPSLDLARDGGGDGEHCSLVCRESQQPISELCAPALVGGASHRIFASHLWIRHRCPRYFGSRGQATGRSRTPCKSRRCTRQCLGSRNACRTHTALRTEEGAFLRPMPRHRGPSSPELFRRSSERNHQQGARWDRCALD